MPCHMTAAHKNTKNKQLCLFVTKKKSSNVMTHFNHQGTTGTQKSCLNSCLGFRQFASVSCRWIQILDSQSRLCVLACLLICVEVFGSQRDIARNFIIIYLAKLTLILLSVVIVQDNLAAWTDFSLRCPVSLALCFLVNVQRETWYQGQSVSQSECEHEEAY